LFERRSDNCEQQQQWRMCWLGNGMTTGPIATEAMAEAVLQYPNTAAKGPQEVAATAAVQQQRVNSPTAASHPAAARMDWKDYLASSGILLDLVKMGVLLRAVIIPPVRLDHDTAPGKRLLLPSHHHLLLATIAATGQALSA
jgi:hypothetical protein